MLYNHHIDMTTHVIQPPRWYDVPCYAVVKLICHPMLYSYLTDNISHVIQPPHWYNNLCYTTNTLIWQSMLYSYHMCMTSHVMQLPHWSYILCYTTPHIDVTTHVIQPAHWYDMPGWPGYHPLALFLTLGNVPSTGIQPSPTSSISDIPSDRRVQRSFMQ